MRTLLFGSIAVEAALAFSLSAMPQAVQPRSTSQSSSVPVRFDAS
jgi:hypothetical protein